MVVLAFAALLAGWLVACCVLVSMFLLVSLRLQELPFVVRMQFSLDTQEHLARTRHWHNGIGIIFLLLCNRPVQLVLIPVNLPCAYLVVPGF